MFESLSQLPQERKNQQEYARPKVKRATQNWTNPYFMRMA